MPGQTHTPASPVVMDSQLDTESQIAYRSLMEQVRALHRLIEGAVSFPRELAFLFEEAVGPEAPSTEPSESVLRQALAQFNAMSDADKKRILNGWSSCPHWPTPAELTADGLYVASVARLMTIGVARRDRHISICHEFRMDDEAHGFPVRLVLNQGVSKREVLDAIDDIRREVVNSWEQFAGMPMISSIAGESEESTPFAVARHER